MVIRHEMRQLKDLDGWWDGEAGMVSEEHLRELFNLPRRIGELELVFYTYAPRSRDGLALVEPQPARLGDICRFVRVDGERLPITVSHHDFLESVKLPKAPGVYMAVQYR